MIDNREKVMISERVYLTGQILGSLLRESGSGKEAFVDLVALAIRGADLCMEQLYPEAIPLQPSEVEITAHHDRYHQYMDSKSGEVRTGPKVTIPEPR